MERSRQIAEDLAQNAGPLDSLSVYEVEEDDKTRRFELPPEQLAALARRSVSFTEEEARAFSSRVTPVMGVRTQLLDEIAGRAHSESHPTFNVPIAPEVPPNVPVIVTWDDEPYADGVIVRALQQRRAFLAKVLFVALFSMATGLLVYALTLSALP